MNTTKVKICGLTVPDDARVAMSLGADYLGIIFANSPRQIDVARAREIRAAVPSATLVAVFKNQPIADVVQAALESDVNLVQLHGSEPPAYCNDVLHRTGKPVVKAFQGVQVPGAAELASFPTTSYFLFDLDRSAALGKRSASVIERAWGDVAGVRALGFRLFVAGGIDANNVRDIVSRTHAFAIDVCRGVEKSPGVKDAHAMERFMAEVRA